jgi:hypothetical protein
MSLTALASIGSALIGSNSARSANRQSVDLAKRGYSYAVADMKRAGLNPILAAKYGPITVPNIQNEGLAGMQAAGLAANSAQALSNAANKDVETEIKDNFRYFSDEVRKVWENSGENVTNFIANTSWNDLGSILGNYIGMEVKQIADGLKQMFGSIKAAVLEALGMSANSAKKTPNPKGTQPHSGSGRGVPDLR